MNGVITLGEMRAKGMTMLEVASCRCERRARLRIERLIAHDSPVPRVALYGRGDPSRRMVGESPLRTARGADYRADLLPAVVARGVGARGPGPSVRRNPPAQL